MPITVLRENCFMKLQLRELNKDNWLETANLSVTEEQKDILTHL